MLSIIFAAKTGLNSRDAKLVNIFSALLEVKMATVFYELPGQET